MINVYMADGPCEGEVKAVPDLRDIVVLERPWRLTMLVPPQLPFTYEPPQAKTYRIQRWSEVYHFDVVEAIAFPERPFIQWSLNDLCWIYPLCKKMLANFRAEHEFYVATCSRLATEEDVWNCRRQVAPEIRRTVLYPRLPRGYCWPIEYTLCHS